MPGGSMGPYKKSRCQNVLHVRNKKAASCKASGARMSSRSKTKRSIGEVQPSGFFKRKTFIRWRDIEEGFASYRRDKNWAETRGESGRLRFQSLVGTIKTIDNSQNIIKVKRVSIPHRYDKNESWLVFGFEAGQEFQSLIGTIKTESQNRFVYGHLVRVSIPHRYDKNLIQFDRLVDRNILFQSLIGTIKTTRLNVLLFPTTQFQSLIGTIKTCSIVRLSGTNKTRFQSLIGTIKTGQDVYMESRTNYSFQSLIGTIKTSSSFCNIC